MVGSPRKGFGVKYEEAFRAKELSKYSLFAKKALFGTKIDGRHGVEMKLDLTHRLSQSFEINVILHHKRFL